MNFIRRGFITVKTKDEGNEARPHNDAFNIKGGTACGKEGKGRIRSERDVEEECVNEDECGFRAGCDSTAVGCH